jgi:hypothetical protein
MGMSEQKYYKYQLFANQDTISWDDYIENLVSPSPEELLIELELIKVLEDEVEPELAYKNSGFENIKLKKLWYLIERILCLSGLTDKALYIFYEYIHESRMQKNIASDFNNSQALACILVKKAMSELNKPKNLRMIKDFLSGEETDDILEIFSVQPKRTFAGIASKIRTDQSADGQAN